MGEQLGVGVFISAMAVFVGGVYLAITKRLDDVFIWALGAELIESILAWGVLGAIVVVAFLIWSVGYTSGAHGHVTYAEGTNRGLASLEKHERAHQRVTAAVGGGGSTVKIWQTKDGGWAGVCRFHDPARVAALPPEKKIAISLSGMIAAPDTTSPTDKPHAKAYAREADNPAQAMREGKKIARRLV